MSWLSLLQPRKIFWQDDAGAFPVATDSVPNADDWVHIPIRALGRPLATGSWPAHPDEMTLKAATAKAERDWREISSGKSGGAAAFSSSDLKRWLDHCLRGKARWAARLDVMVEAGSRKASQPLALWLWTDPVRRTAVAACLCIRESMDAGASQVRCWFRLDSPGALEHLKLWVASPGQHLLEVREILKLHRQNSGIRSWNDVREAFGGSRPPSLAELAWHREMLREHTPLVLRDLPSILNKQSWDSLREHCALVTEALTPARSDPATPREPILKVCRDKLPTEPTMRDARAYLRMTAPLHLAVPESHEMVASAAPLLKDSVLEVAASQDMRRRLVLPPDLVRPRTRAPSAESPAPAAPSPANFLSAVIDAALRLNHFATLAAVLGYAGEERYATLKQLAAKIAEGIPSGATTAWQDYSQQGLYFEWIESFLSLDRTKDDTEWRCLTTLLPLDVGGRPVFPPAFWKASRQWLRRQDSLTPWVVEMGLWAWSRLPDTDGVAYFQRFASPFYEASLPDLLAAIARTLVLSQVGVLHSAQHGALRNLQQWLSFADTDLRLQVIEVLLPFAADCADVGAWLLRALSSNDDQWVSDAALLWLRSAAVLRPWSAECSGWLAGASFDNDAWERLCFELARAGRDEFAGALGWLDGLPGVAGSQKAAVERARRWLSADPNGHLWNPALRVDAEGRAMLAGAIIARLDALVADALSRNTGELWDALIAEARDLNLNFDGLAGVALSQWFEQFPSPVVLAALSRLCVWHPSLTGQAAVRRVLGMRASESLHDFQAFTDCWKAIPQKQELNDETARCVWSRFKGLPVEPDEEVLLIAAWHAAASQRPMAAVEWWLGVAVEAFQQPGKDPVDDLCNDVPLWQSRALLGRIRDACAEGSPALQIALERFAAQFLRKPQSGQWRELNDKLPRKDSRGQLLEDLLLKRR